MYLDINDDNISKYIYKEVTYQYLNIGSAAVVENFEQHHGRKPDRAEIIEETKKGDLSDILREKKYQHRAFGSG